MEIIKKGYKYITLKISHEKIKVLLKYMSDRKLTKEEDELFRDLRGDFAGLVISKFTDYD